MDKTSSLLGPAIDFLLAQVGEHPEQGLVVCSSEIKCVLSTPTQPSRIEIQTPIGHLFPTTIKLRHSALSDVLIEEPLDWIVFEQPMRHVEVLPSCLADVRKLAAHREAPTEFTLRLRETTDPRCHDLVQLVHLRPLQKENVENKTVKWAYVTYLWKDYLGLSSCAWLMADVLTGTMAVPLAILSKEATPEIVLFLVKKFWKNLLQEQQQLGPGPKSDQEQPSLLDIICIDAVTPVIQATLLNHKTALPDSYLLVPLPALARVRPCSLGNRKLLMQYAHNA